MNKKIQEFAKQAGAEFYTGFAGSPNSVKFMEEDLEKFAELIVRECLIIAATQTNADKVFKQIQKEFGVKVAKETK